MAKISKNLFVLSALTILSAAIASGQQSSQKSPPAQQPGTAAPSAGPSASPTAGGTQGGAQGALSQITDSAALNYLHHVNQLEINEGQTAQGLAQGQQAQTLAEALVTDHQQGDQQVLLLAGQKGIAIFGFQPADYESATDAMLSSLNGQNFDQAFLQVQLQDHQAVLNRLQSMMNEVTDPEIKNLINQTIPVVQNHIQLAGGSAQPGSQPSGQPSGQPSAQPSPQMSPQPGSQPSAQPSPSASPGMSGTGGSGTMS